MMETTRASLLARIKDPADTQAWRRFRNLYAPLLYRYARGRGLSRADAEDVRDQCLEVVARVAPLFDYDRRKGGFKNWLRRVANNKVTDLVRKHRAPVADSREMRGLPDPGPGPEEVWEQHWRQEHLKYCVEQVRGSVSEMNYRVFHMLLFGECTVEEVCGRLGLNANQVYKAKARVLQRVRMKLAEFEEEPRP